MAIPKSISVYVEALDPKSPTYGDCTIIIPAGDPDWAEFFTTCREFFDEQDRPEDADKFGQAVRQTPGDPTDD